MKEEKKLYKAIPATETGRTVTCEAKDGTYIITSPVSYRIEE